MRWSYSKLSAYRTCPAKVRFKDAGHKSPTGQAAQRGLDAHAVMENYIKRASEDCIPLYKSFLNNLRAAGAHAELKVGVDGFWNKADWDSAWGVGILDAVVFTPSVLSIFDWKTGKAYDDHVRQAETYAALAAAQVERYDRIDVSFVYTDLGKTSLWSYEAPRVAEIRSQLSEEVHKMDSDEEKIPMPSMACRWCPYSKSKGGPCAF